MLPETVHFRWGDPNDPPLDPALWSFEIEISCPNSVVVPATDEEWGIYHGAMTCEWTQWRYISNDGVDSSAWTTIVPEPAADLGLLAGIVTIGLIRQWRRWRRGGSHGKSARRVQDVLRGGGGRYIGRKQGHALQGDQRRKVPIPSDPLREAHIGVQGSA